MCFLDARLDLGDEDTAIALSLEDCSASSYAELIKSNIPSPSSLLFARSIAPRPSLLSTLGVFPFGSNAAPPTRGEILAHLGATSRKPRSVKRKETSSSEKDRPVPAKVQKSRVSPPPLVREPGRASSPPADVQNSGASPPSPAQELERASSPLVEVQELGAFPPPSVQEPEHELPTLNLTLLSPPRPDVGAKGLSGADAVQPSTVLPIIVGGPPADKARPPLRRTTERKKLKPKADAVGDSLLSSAELAVGVVSSILKESAVGESKGLPVDDALALSFQGIASVSS